MAISNTRVEKIKVGDSDQAIKTNVPTQESIPPEECRNIFLFILFLDTSRFGNRHRKDQRE